VEAVQGYRDLFIDSAAASGTYGTSLRVTDSDIQRRASSESSHSDVSCHVDLAPSAAFGIIGYIINN